MLIIRISVQLGDSKVIETSVATDRIMGILEARARARVRMNSKLEIMTSLT
jgi:hypothetical protein